ncbi:hypothetical protein ACINWC692_2096 [Acinetobacter baumannii WC-692]|nr:hypothetical protein ACINWC692_2096 [Acinetobacter baumannii WC-692]
MEKAAAFKHGHKLFTRINVSGNVKMTPQQHLKIDPLG